ncbi:MAG: ABC transporter permease [Candidatus Omnitrophica bacterium]|nr:ABC transporter permease [Candidatus Omnitrophota bacterium]
MIIKKNLDDFFYYIGGIFMLMGHTIYLLFARKPRFDLLYKQLVRVGLESFPIVFLTSIFIGIVIALQSAYQMQKLSAEIYIAALVALSVVRELGPVITGLVVAGRVGASVSAELGTMNVTEQIDAMEAMATDPVQYLVIPRFLALLIMLPILTVYADIIGILGGFLIGVTKLGIGATQYIKLTFEALSMKDIYSGFSKPIVFAVIIALISAQEGFIAKGGAEGVGRATTRTVVNTFILIIMADCLITAFFYFIRL